MKSPDNAEILGRDTGMETDKIDARTPGSGKVPGKNRVRSGAPKFDPAKFGSSRFGLAPMPLEWMDDSSWRLPSGKALAEFALQAGFLAPLMLRMPRLMGGGRGGETGTVPKAGKKGKGL
jgi:hypothetical protein